MPSRLIIALLVVCYLLAPKAGAQPGMNDLVFHSALERQLFEGAVEGNPDYIALFMCVEREADAKTIQAARNDITNVIDELDGMNITTKSQRKQSRVIFKIVQDRFLRKYELENTFCEMIQSGVFNCVSATAVYALVFESLGIPYVISETPTHVYMVAWPGPQGVIIESTYPENGAFQISDRDKMRQVEQLARSKIIDRGEYLNMTDVEIYAELAGESNKAIDLLQLVAIQYFNVGLYHASKEEYESAIQFLEKAGFLYPRSKSVAHSLNAVRSIYLNLEGISGADKVRHLIQWANDTLNSNNLMAAQHTYEALLKRHMHSVTERHLLDSLSNALIIRLNDSTLRHDIALVYYYERARNAAAEIQLDTALKYITLAMTINAEHSDVRHLFWMVVLQNSKFQRNIDLLLSELKSYGDRFEPIRSDPRYDVIIAEVYLRKGLESFVEGQISSGSEYFGHFESKVNNEMLNMLDPNLITQAYSEAVSAWFKIGNKSKARAYADKGLEYVPNSYELRRRRDMLR